jgi:voltage-gated potassium channel
MTNYLISLSYKLDTSIKYKRFKKFTYNILENDSYIYKKYFDFLMIFLLLSTIAILIFEVNNKDLGFLNYYQFFAIIVFALEYLGRLWVCTNIHSVIIEDYENNQLLNIKYNINKSLKRIISDKLDFIFSPLAIIDLLSILPYYRPLRLFRILLIFRLFKILRYSNSLKEFIQVFKERKFELFTLGLLYITVVFFSSTIMYIYEGPEGINPKIINFFDAIYWSIITISTVGYGDVTPITSEGKFVTGILIVTSFLVIAFGTSIITTGLSDRMETIKENRVQQETSSMNDFVIVCGFGVMGKYFCEELVGIARKFIIIDINKDAINHAKSLNYLAINSDATNMKTLEMMGVNKGASCVIALTNDDAVNLSIVLSVRALNSNIKIISRVNNSNSKKKFEIAGVNETILFNDVTAFVASEYLGQPVAFEAIDGILLNKDIKVIIDEVEISDNSKIIGKNINLINFKDYNLTLIGVINPNKLEEFIFNPSNLEHIVQKKDILVIIGFKSSISQLKADLINLDFKV